MFVGVASTAALPTRPRGGARTSVPEKFYATNAASSNVPTPVLAPNNSHTNAGPSPHPPFAAVHPHKINSRPFRPLSTTHTHLLPRHLLHIISSSLCITPNNTNNTNNTLLIRGGGSTQRTPHIPLALLPSRALTTTTPARQAMELALGLQGDHRREGTVTERRYLGYRRGTTKAAAALICPLPFRG